MEIKQGDKVRVSSRLPRIYERFGSMIAPYYECKVVEINDGMALLDSIPDKHIFLFPLKYLVKVDAEAKEPKFKKGDKVVLRRFNGAFVKAGSIGEVWDMNPVLKHCYDVAFDGGGLTLEEKYLEPYTEPTAPTIKVGDRVRCKNPIRLANSTDDDFIGTVTDAENGWFIVHMNNGAVFQTCHESDLELVQPTEQTEAEKKPNVGSIKIPVEVDLSDSYWDAYAADLTKEIALKVANKYSDPEQAAEYAVQVAKAVVEGLKSK